VIRLKEQKGFTLIEIVMVIILLSILAAVAAPKFIDLTTEAHDAAIDGAFGAVNSALAIAIAKSKTVPDEDSAKNKNFEDLVYDNLDFSNGISRDNYSGGVNNNASNVTFDIKSGTTGAGRIATVEYLVDVDGSPSLLLTAKSDF
jgi:MSHA pilin protein MshA